MTKYKLVPVEPTQEMLEAAHNAIQSEGLTTTTWLRTTCYRAMLAAAPQPSAEQFCYHYVENGEEFFAPPETFGLPPYPEGEVVGACVCGSWPGGKCLRCPVVRVGDA